MAKELLADRIRVNYDPEGDVLYISFGEPQAADDADVTDDDVIVRTNRGKVVGITILDARARLIQPA